LTFVVKAKPLTHYEERAQLDLSVDAAYVFADDSQGNELHASEKKYCGEN
jgi:hypothetical protein